MIHNRTVRPVLLPDGHAGIAVQCTTPKGRNGGGGGGGGGGRGENTRYICDHPRENSRNDELRSHSADADISQWCSDRESDAELSPNSIRSHDPPRLPMEPVADWLVTAKAGRSSGVARVRRLITVSSIGSNICES